MTKYWVVGGHYVDTTFHELANGSKEERFGPFDSYEKAHAKWASEAWSTVDDCHRCYRIIKINEEEFAHASD